jgi:uncharacterized membrane protein YphA (DoxX/SURF4 family)
MTTSTLTDITVLGDVPAPRSRATRVARTVARAAVPTARIALGLMFLVVGLNGFLDFLPHPNEPMSAGAMQFVGGLAASGYFFPLLKGTETLAGALLLANRFVPLALAVLAPILINIVAFHLFLAPGSSLPLALLVLELGLVCAYRRAYGGMLTAKARPALAL